MGDVALKDLCLLIVDSEHKTAPKDPDGLHPLVRTTDLGRARADLTRAQRVNSEVHSLWTKRAIPTVGDLILAREAPVGGIFRIPDGVEPVLGQRTVLLRPDPSVVDGRFLMYRLAGDDLQARMTEMSTGSTVSHLNMADIRAFPIPRIPPLPTQRLIATVLSAFDTLIENNERRIELLEDLARSLYREWFLHFRFPGREAAEPIGCGQEELPSGWSMRAIGEIASAVRGQSYRRADLVEAGGMPFLNLKCVRRDGGFRRGGLKRYQGRYKDNQRVFPGDVLVAVTDMTQERRVIAQAFRAPELTEEFAIPSLDLVLLQPKSPDLREFLYATLRFSESSTRLREFANGANVLHLAVERILEHEIVLPPARILARFAAITAAISAESETLEVQTQQLNAARDLLLPRLVTGQLDISDVDLGALAPPDPE